MSDEAELLWLWDQKDYDTFDIAAHFGITEAKAEIELWKAREVRRLKAGETNGTCCADPGTAQALSR